MRRRRQRRLRPPGLQDDHRLQLSRRPARPTGTSGRGDALEIDQDGPRPTVAGQQVEIVADIDIGHVAKRRHLRETDAPRHAQSTRAEAIIPDCDSNASCPGAGPSCAMLRLRLDQGRISRQCSVRSPAADAAAPRRASPGAARSWPSPLAHHQRDPTALAPNAAISAGTSGPGAVITARSGACGRSATAANGAPSPRPARPDRQSRWLRDCAGPPRQRNPALRSADHRDRARLKAPGRDCEWSQDVSLPVRGTNSACCGC